jgi:hypothetical protein
MTSLVKDLLRVFLEHGGETNLLKRDPGHHTDFAYTARRTKLSEFPISAHLPSEMFAVRPRGSENARIDGWEYRSQRSENRMSLEEADLTAPGDLFPVPEGQGTTPID